MKWNLWCGCISLDHPTTIILYIYLKKYIYMKIFHLLLCEIILSFCSCIVCLSVLLDFYDSQNSFHSRENRMFSSDVCGSLLNILLSRLCFASLMPSLTSHIWTPSYQNALLHSQILFSHPSPVHHAPAWSPWGQESSIILLHLDLPHDICILLLLSLPTNLNWFSANHQLLVLYIVFVWFMFWHNSAVLEYFERRP